MLGFGAKSQIFLGIILVVILLQAFSFDENQYASAEENIPDDIKEVVKSWSEGKTSDNEFVDALVFLIKERVIQSPAFTIVDDFEDSTIKLQVPVPSWIKFNAKVWSEGYIDDIESAQ